MKATIVVYDLDNEDDLDNLKSAIREAGYKIQSVSLPITEIAKRRQEINREKRSNQ